MTSYERIKADMTDALKMGDKPRRLVLADIVAAIDKAATAGKTRVEITDLLVDEVLIKYKKTVQEMIDTCPDTEQYAARKAEYIYNMTIVDKYAPQMITDEKEIEHLITEICNTNELEINFENRGKIMKTVMPILKMRNCDLKVAQTVLKNIIK
jgi:uncharacterized protein YqeY